ncbi:hypothetical protein [Xanthomonas sacchari]|uniref:hypothetical protein n=1 Tax=Xanthomonas sacchari TaxID=56458 RepID=UPI0022522D10|nr:hypothetical protein [Xanthomonas sacchari]
MGNKSAQIRDTTVFSTTLQRRFFHKARCGFFKVIAQSNKKMTPPAWPGSARLRASLHRLRSPNRAGKRLHRQAQATPCGQRACAAPGPVMTIGPPNLDGRQRDAWRRAPPVRHSLAQYTGKLMKLACCGVCQIRCVAFW